MPSKHRKRAAVRREQWRVIGDAARLALRAHIVHAGSRAQAAADQQPRQCV
jgi:hypothetical protein